MNAVEGFETGFAVADITPPLGTPIGGNFRSDYGARGIHMPLQAHAMVVRGGAVTLALVTLDLLVVTEAMAFAIRRRVTEALGLDEEHVLVAATHTHSGPATLAVTGDAIASKEVVADLCTTAAEVVIRVYAALVPSELAVARFEVSGLSFNRRLAMRDGSTRMNWEGVPLEDIVGTRGPVDPEGLVIVSRRAGRVVGLLVNYALHPAVLAGGNWDLGPDWPGYLRQALAAHVGTDVPVLFLNGAEGNINHLDAWDPRQGRGAKEAQRIGYVLANGVLAAMGRCDEIAGILGATRDVLQVPLRPVSEHSVAAARARLDGVDTSAVTGQEDGMPPWFFDRELVDHAARGDALVTLEVQSLRIGSVALVGLAGEFFAEFGLRIKASSPARHTAVVGLANGAVGYVPVPEAVAQGGYEGETWRYNQLDLSAGDRTVACAQAQLSRLFSG